MWKKITFIAIFLLVLDGIYLNLVSRSYAHQIASIQRTAMNINMVGVIVCYTLLIFCLYYFIIKDKKPVIDAFLLGFIIYGVYDATSYAVFKKWSPGLAIVDTLWGGILFSLTTALTYQFS